MSPIQLSLESPISAALGHSMHNYWRLLLAEGIVLNVLGLAAIVMPNLAGLVVIVCLGWLLLVCGVVGLVFTVKARKAPGYGWSMLSTIVAVLAGGLLLWSPLQAMVTLTFVLTGYFVADGFLTIAFAISHRRDLSGKWGWMMVNGVVDLILAAIIISGLPGTLVWVFGLLVGIDMIFGGASLIALALAARRETSTPSFSALP